MGKSMTHESQSTTRPNLTSEQQFLRGPIYLFLSLGLLAMYLGVMPTGIIGAACLLLPLARILEPLGERIPILKDYLGLLGRGPCDV